MKGERTNAGFRLFKPTYRDRHGQRRAAGSWYVEFRDALEIIRRLPAFRSKAASAELGRNLVALVSFHEATGGGVDPALTGWLAGLAERTREKLSEYGLIPAERSGAARLLTEHVADFKAALAARGNSAAYVALVPARVRRLLDGIKAKRFADIRGERVAAWLADQRADQKDADGKVTRRGIAAQTSNFYLSALKSFVRWAQRERRTADDPVAHLDALNVRTDRRHDRRALAAVELRALLDTTRTGPERFGMPAEARYWLYRVAVETGLRANELRTLTRANFRLDGDAPTVTVAAAYSKHRRQDTLPLRPTTAAELAEFVQGLAPTAQVFGLTPCRHSATKMFRQDVTAAGLAYRDDEGRFADFHSLRHTFITNLANGGVHPKKAQALARHCTIGLTMDRYTHTVHGELAGALEALPDLSGPTPERARATGTDDAAAESAADRTNADSVLAFCLAQTGRREAIPVDSHRRNAPHSGVSQTLVNARFPAKSTGKTAQWRGARAAEGAGFENRCTGNRTAGSNPALSVS